jgi:hypothetical protein
MLARDQGNKTYMESLKQTYEVLVQILLGICQILEDNPIRITIKLTKLGRAHTIHLSVKQSFLLAFV